MIQVNFHGDKLCATSHNYGEGSTRKFCTFELNSEGNNVTVYLKSVDDARQLVDAAVLAYRNIEAIELETRVMEVERQVQLDKENWPDLEEVPF